MTCEFDIKNMKPGAVLIMQENGVVECVSKEEFLKSCLNECQESLAIVKQNETRTGLIEEKVKKQDEKINKFCKALYEFINIMKGENTNEKK